MAQFVMSYSVPDLWTAHVVLGREILPQMQQQESNLPTTPADKKRKRRNEIIEANSKSPEQGASASDDKAQPNEQRATIVDLLILGKTLERKRLRDKQRRYRKKKADFTVRFEEDNQRLLEEINQLERHRRVCASSSIWEVAIEYFRILHQFLQREQHIFAASEFLIRTMSPDVIYNARQGPMEILGSWRRFDGLKLELDGLDMSVRGFLVATTTTSFTITERTLRTVFPHLCIRDAEGLVSLSFLATKLLGQRIVMRGTTRFEWNCVSGRVARVTSQSDLLTPMLRLVGCLDLVSRVFEKALVTPDFQ